MKRMVAVVVMAGLFLIAAAPANAGGRGGGHGVRGGGSHGHGHGFHGHRFPGHRHGFRSSVVIGTGFWLGPYWGPYWYPPYYSPYAPGYAAPVVVESQPQTYIQAPAPSYWYYCEDAKAYYPYVKECPAGWLTVVPQALPESQR